MKQKVKLKQTKLGMILEEWKVKELGQVAAGMCIDLVKKDMK